MTLREISLVLHLFGFGLFVAILTAGFMIEMQYRRTSDMTTKATLLGALRPIGLLSPIAVLLLLITGVANMYALGVGLFDFGWLTAKIIFFAVAATNGAISGVRSRKRGVLLGQMIKGESSEDAESKLKEYNKQQLLFYSVNGIVLVIIVYLSVYGRTGGQ